MTDRVRRDWCEEHNRGSLAEFDGPCPECEARSARLRASSHAADRRQKQEEEHERQLRASHGWPSREPNCAVCFLGYLLDEARRERDELRRTFDLMWDADQRAIKRWQEAAPTGADRSMTWPDRSQLTEWLLNQVDAEREACAEIAERVQGRAAENAQGLMIKPRSLTLDQLRALDNNLAG